MVFVAPSEDELMKIVWGNVIVEEIGLTRNISVLREVLDDNDHKKPKFIETVSRFGYRFAAAVKKTRKLSVKPACNRCRWRFFPFKPSV